MKTNAMVRREEAGEQAHRAQRKIKPLEYEIRNGDIQLMSGPYVGRMVSELFQQGPIERDYIVSKLWFLGDAEVEKIIKDLVCE